MIACDSRNVLNFEKKQVALPSAKLELQQSNVLTLSSSTSIL
jgi:hypothetical protein